MSEPINSKILSHLKSPEYRPTKPRGLAKELDLAEEHNYPAFRMALKELMHQGRAVLGSRGAVMLPGGHEARDEFTGTYRHNKRGFGFVVPTDPQAREDLFIPPGDNMGALSGDTVRAKITSRGQKDGKAMYSGRITEIITRGNKRFVGSLAKVAGEWVVMPDGNTLTEPILTPDAAARHIRVGTKVVVEITSYPDEVNDRPVGVITEVLGAAGEKDVDLKSIIVQFGLPGPFPETVLASARKAVDEFNPESERAKRLDLTDHIICTIDPNDAKDYDDAISLRELADGNWELGVHIADVSYFVKEGTPLDEEATARGNSCYFPGFVIPMLPEILSNGVCSLQQDVPRLCKSVFITYDEDAKPVSAKFANTVIKSAARLRYLEAQAIIDNEQEIPHPDGPRRVRDYPADVVGLLHDMNALAKRLQKRRQAQGQIVLDLPEVELVLDEDGKVVGTTKEDTSFTHTLIEMFMVEANEAVARLFDSLHVPFIRRTHPEPDMQDSDKLRHFITVAGHKIGKVLDRKEIQSILAHVKGRPEAFAINLAILKSLTRAEYSPEPIGHYALASEHYCHYTSPIRRYADLTIHRLLDAYFEAREHVGQRGGRRNKVVLEDVPTFDELVELGRHISFTERQAEDAERELRKVKILELLKGRIGEEFDGVITGIANFGIFVQLNEYLIDGLIKYEDLMDDWWDVDARSGVIRGQRTGKRIGIGDPCKAIVVKVDPARRELDLAITHVQGRSRKEGEFAGEPKTGGPQKKAHKKKEVKHPHRGGGSRRNQMSKQKSPRRR
jgi:ribonuclease R